MVMRIDVSDDALTAAKRAYAGDPLLGSSRAEGVRLALEAAAPFIEGHLCEDLVRVLFEKAELQEQLGRTYTAKGLREAAIHIDAYLVHHLRPAQEAAMEGRL